MRTSFCFLIAGFAAMIPATATSAEPDDFLACREVASDEARLQCYDAIADFRDCRAGSCGGNTTGVGDCCAGSGGGNAASHLD